MIVLWSIYVHNIPSSLSLEGCPPGIGWQSAKIYQVQENYAGQLSDRCCRLRTHGDFSRVEMLGTRIALRFSCLCSRRRKAAPWHMGEPGVLVASGEDKDVYDLEFYYPGIFVLQGMSLNITKNIHINVNAKPTTGSSLAGRQMTSSRSPTHFLA